MVTQATDVLPALAGRRTFPWFESAAGALCAAWAFAAWLTVIPNQDMLVDGTQVQRVLQDPQVVLAFPGQKHGGVLEYPYLLLSEALAPGNTYAHTALRIAFAFLTGFIVARLFLRLFPGFPRWAFLGIIAVGPSMIHGLAGPPDNPVAVWWLVGNYDLAWLLVAAGALVLAGPGQLDGPGPTTRRALAAGLLVGLGIYAHPMILLLVAPLGVLVLLRRPAAIRKVLWVGAAVAVGMIPLGISYFIYADLTTWDPSHFPVFDPNAARAVLGLNPDVGYVTSLLPLALGFSTTPDIASPALQGVVVLAVLAVALVVVALGAWRSIVNRAWPGPGFAVAATWLTLALSLVVFSTMVNPVWLYATGLAVLLWLTVGALPGLVPLKHLGSVAAVAAIVVAGLSTWTHNYYWYSQFPSRVVAKADYMRSQENLAQALEGAGVRMLYGSYYDVIPIGYASGSRLHYVTSTYNRFRLTTEEASADRIEVAVNTLPPETWGVEALAAVRAACTPTGTDITYEEYAYSVFSCPRSFFTTA
ncbi:MAG: hypothetical protein QG671_4227 [Actinomycetota bacterium]|nr:hypothetical protein [Actinomycetota bacterium]